MPRSPAPGRRSRPGAAVTPADRAALPSPDRRGRARARRGARPARGAQRGQADLGRPWRGGHGGGRVRLLRRRPGAPARRLDPRCRRRRHHLSRAARRGRPDHPVELPARDRFLEDRPGARRRQHDRAEAGRAHAADGGRAGADRGRCGPAGGGAERGGGAGAHGRRADHRAPRRGEGGVHGLDRGGPAHPGARRRDDQAGDARAGRQVRQRGVRGRRPRAGRAARRPRPCSATPARTAARARASSSRRPRMDRFMEALEEAVEAVKVGDPLDDVDRDGPARVREPARDRGLLRGRRRSGGDPRQRTRGQGLLVPADGAGADDERRPRRRARRSSVRWPA